MDCSKGEPMREVSRRRISETTEEVVYVRQRIKHFTREGSEFWAEVDIPDLIEKTVEVDIVEYRCDNCQETATVRVEAGKEH